MLCAILTSCMYHCQAQQKRSPARTRLLVIKAAPRFASVHPHTCEASSKYGTNRLHKRGCHQRPCKRRQTWSLRQLRIYIYVLLQGVNYKDSCIRLTSIRWLLLKGVHVWRSRYFSIWIPASLKLLLVSLLPLKLESHLRPNELAMALLQPCPEQAASTRGLHAHTFHIVFVRHRPANLHPLQPCLNRLTHSRDCHVAAIYFG